MRFVCSLKLETLGALKDDPSVLQPRGVWMQSTCMMQFDENKLEQIIIFSKLLKHKSILLSEDLSYRPYPPPPRPPHAVQFIEAHLWHLTFHSPLMCFIRHIDCRVIKQTSWLWVLAVTQQLHQGLRIRVKHFVANRGNKLTQRHTFTFKANDPQWANGLRAWPELFS